jgi:predicted alpha/beta superfamily hydrolase
MKQIIVTLSALMLAVSCSAQSATSKADSSRQIVLGTVRTFYSKVLSEQREIWVSVPSDFHAGRKGERFPVAVVLDGPDHFYSLAGMLDRFATNAGNEVCPPMIVVALVNTNRERDFYPDKGDNSFAQFLKTELLPYVDSNFPTQPFRILIGHSLAGLRTVHTALFDGDLFRGYIAIDPSIGHRRNAWYESAKNRIDDYFPGCSVYVAMAQTAPGKFAQDTTLLKADTTSATNHMRRIMQFCENMQRKNTGERANFKWDYFPNESHQSVTQLAMYEGMKFIFRWFKPTFYNTFFDQQVSPAAASAMYEHYYTSVSAQLGYTFNPPVDEKGLIDYLFYKNQPQKALAIAELNLKYYPNREISKQNYVAAKWGARKNVGALLQTKTAEQVYRFCINEARGKEPEYNISEVALNMLGYQLLSEKRAKDAEVIFRLNTVLYPASSNAYDSYGECLLALHRREEAMAAYKRSLELDPNNANARRVLNGNEK